MYGIGLYGTTPYGTMPGVTIPTEVLTDTVIVSSPMTTGAWLLQEAISILLSSNVSIPFNVITDTAASSSAAIATANYVASAIDEIQLTGYGLEVAYKVLTDTVATTGNATVEAIRIVAILETLRLVTDMRGSESVRVAEILALFDAAYPVNPVTVSDTASIVGDAQARALAYAMLLDAVSVLSTATGTAIMTVLLKDGIELDCSVLTTATLFAMIEDGVSMSIALTQGGVAYTARTMNAVTKGVTEYANYPFNSFAQLNGQLYGALDDGLYLLDGADDAGTDISAYARTALSRIAQGRQAQVDTAYLGYSSDGSMQLKTIVTEPTGAKTSRVYELNMQNAAATRSGRIKLGRGVKSAYWAFEIGNVLGSDFTIDIVELHVLALSRRI